MRARRFGPGGRSHSGLAAPLLLAALCACLGAGEARADFSDLDTFIEHLALQIIHTERKTGRLTDKGVLVDPSNFFERTTERRLPLSEELSHRLTTAFRRRGVRVLSGSGKEDVMILRGRWRDVPGEGALYLSLAVGKLVCTERDAFASGKAVNLVCEETEVDAAADERISRDAVEAYLEADLEFWGRHAMRELERAAPGHHRRPVYIQPAEIVGVPRPERFGHFGQYLVLGWLTPAFAGSRLFFLVPSRTGDSRDLSVHVFIIGNHVEVVLRMLEAQGMYAARVRMEKALFRDMLPSDAETLLAECGEHLGTDRLADAAQCYARVRSDFPGNAAAVAQVDAGLLRIVNRSVESAEGAIARGALDEARGHVARLGRLHPGHPRVSELVGMIVAAQRAVDEAEARRAAEEREAARRQAQVKQAIESAAGAIVRGALDEARRHVVELRRLRPGHPRVSELEGKIEAAQRAIDEAEARRAAEEREAARRQAQVKQAIESGEGALGRGRLGEARRHVAELRRLHPGHPRVAELDGGIRTVQRVTALLGREFSPDVKDSSGWTDLHYAAVMNLAAVAEALLDAGMDVDVRSKDDVTFSDRLIGTLQGLGVDFTGDKWRTRGRTPLWFAAMFDARETARVLVGRGADLEARDTEHGMTPLRTALLGNSRAVAELLVDEGADANARDGYGYPMLLDAANYGRLWWLEFLLQHGAAIEATNQGGVTALMSATYGGELDAVKLLVQRGADVHARDGQGFTALHHVWRSGAIAEELLASGADVNAEGGNGDTPLDLALIRASTEEEDDRKRSMREMAELLRRHGGRCATQC